MMIIIVMTTETVVTMLISTSDTRFPYKPTRPLGHACRPTKYNFSGAHFNLLSELLTLLNNPNHAAHHTMFMELSYVVLCARDGVVSVAVFVSKPAKAKMMCVQR